MIMLKIFLMTILSTTQCAKLLGIFPIAGMSHYILSSKLMRGLADAGHDVTMVTPYTLKNPPMNGKYKEIVLEGFAEKYLKHMEKFQLFHMGKMSFAELIMTISYQLIDSANDTLHHPKMLELAKSGQKFDAVLMEQFHNPLKVYAHIFDCPLIILNSLGPNSIINPSVGNPSPVSYSAHAFLEEFAKDNTIAKRANNLFAFILDFLFNKFYVFPKQNKILECLYPNSPSIQDLFTNVSLVLLNSHTSIYPALPIVPNMVEIGGYFIDPPKKLPQDLQEFLDTAKDGVVYFSMGSMLKSKDFQKEKKKSFLSVLGRLKQKVIWKFEEDLPGKPENIMIRKWLPQQDILAHPNIKLFITHGGLLSTTETIYHGVPILAIPVFADQPTNAKRAEDDGYGLKLGYHDPDFSEEKLERLVNELLNNPKYAESAKYKSKLFHDRPMKPMEAANYWVDYVIRHKGAEHLRVAGTRIPWYQYFLVDVMVGFLSVLLFFIYFTKGAFRQLMSLVQSMKRSRDLNKKQN